MPRSASSDERLIAPGHTDRQLAELSERLALSLEAGIDIRRLWQSEAERASGRKGQVYRAVAERLTEGDSLEEALQPWRGYFPTLWVSLVGVGELTGRLPVMLRRLATEYNHRAETARNLLHVLAWPLMQLAIALAVVGLLIGIGGLISDFRGNPIDLLGFGLVGHRGLLLYGGMLATLLLAGLVAWRSLRTAHALRAQVLGKLTRWPLIGHPLNQLALARIAWTLRLTLDTDLDLRKVVPLVLNASDNQHYQRVTSTVLAHIDQRRPLSEGFANTKIFEKNFIDALQVAEESGQIVETMDRLSAYYEKRVEEAITRLASVLGGIVWFAVAALIIALIFRLFSFYTGAIYDALEGF